MKLFIQKVIARIMGAKLHAGSTTIKGSFASGKRDANGFDFRKEYA